MNLLTSDEFIAKVHPDSALTDAEKFAIRVEAQKNGMLATISYAIKQARKNEGLTQAALSEITGIPQSELSNLENEKSNPTLETLAKLYEALDIRHRVTFKGSKTDSEILAELNKS